MYGYFVDSYGAELDKKVPYPKKQDDIRCTHWCYYTNISDLKFKLDLIKEEYFSFDTFTKDELDKELFWVNDYYRF